MFDKMKGMYDMARKAKAIQKKLRKTKITANALDEQIKVIINGEMTVEDVSIADSLLEPSNKADLETGLKEAINQAHKQAQQIAAQESKDLMGGLGM